MRFTGINYPNMPVAKNVEYPPAASASGGHSAFMVALGNNRNNGSSLGAFYLNANNALTNSNGNNWRARTSPAIIGPSEILNRQSLTVLLREYFDGCLPQLNRNHTTKTVRAFRVSKMFHVEHGVKDLHTTRASRALRVSNPLSRTEALTGRQSEALTGRQSEALCQSA